MIGIVTIAFIVIALSVLASRCFDDDDNDQFWHDSYR